MNISENIFDYSLTSDHAKPIIISDKLSAQELHIFDNTVPEE